MIFDAGVPPLTGFGIVPEAVSRRWMEQSFADAVGYRQRTFAMQVWVSSTGRLMCSVSGY